MYVWILRDPYTTEGGGAPSLFLICNCAFPDPQDSDFFKLDLGDRTDLSDRSDLEAEADKCNHVLQIYK